MIGVGYVGLPLLVELARAGFRATGYDKDRDKVRLLGMGESYIADVPSATLRPLVASGLLRASSDLTSSARPTRSSSASRRRSTRRRTRTMRFIESATDEIAQRQHPGMLIVLESTTYPGTTREVLVPRLTRGRATRSAQTSSWPSSPERVDPGNTRRHAEHAQGARRHDAARASR